MSAQDWAEEWSTFLEEPRVAVLSLWETILLTPSPSRWLPSFLPLTGMTWDKDVRCHGDHLQENTGKEGCRRCNIQKDRFGLGEVIFCLYKKFFFCVWNVSFCFYKKRCQRASTALVKKENDKVLLQIRKLLPLLTTPQEFYSSTLYFPILSTSIIVEIGLRPSLESNLWVFPHTSSGSDV